MNKIIQEGKGRKIEVDYKNKLIYKSGSILNLFIEWRNLNKIYNLGLNVPKPINFFIKPLFKAKIIMDYIEGETWEEKFPKLTYKEKKEVAFKLGKLLKSLNYYKIWHKDLHKGNIIITPSKDIYLIDLYKLKKSFSIQKCQLRQLSILYGAFIKDLDIKIIFAFLKGYLNNFQNIKEFIKKYEKRIHEEGIENLIKILKKEISNLNNCRRFKKLFVNNWSGYIALRTNGLLYEKEIINWLQKYQNEKKILGDVIKEGRSALVIKYKNLCIKFFKKRVHKWKGLKDLILYYLKYTRARRSFLNSYLFYFISGATPPPLAFFENNKGEGILFTFFVENSSNFSEFINKISEKDKFIYVYQLLEWYKRKVLNYNFISKDANLRNILIDSQKRIWLIDSLDIQYTNNFKKKIKSFKRLLKDLYINEKFKNILNYNNL